MSAQSVTAGAVLLAVWVLLIRYGRRVGRPVTRRAAAGVTRRRAGLRFVGDLLAGAVRLVVTAAIAFGPRTHGRR